MHRNFVANVKLVDYFAGLAADQIPSREVIEQRLSAHLSQIDRGHAVILPHGIPISVIRLMRLLAIVQLQKGFG